jgi:SAM-dependent methyltransferase
VERIRNFSSQSEDYPKSFAVFLAHTDQKTNASAWLDRRIAELPRREVFIDAGAGNGKLTAQLAPQFARTIAVEPNPALARELSMACPTAEIQGAPIQQARPTSAGDFVLCSHVLYYIDSLEWGEILRTIADWLAPGGLAVVALQNSNTDCMSMLRQFTGRTFRLGDAADAFAKESAGRFQVEVETVPAHVETDSLEAAYIVAEFMLNLAPTTPMPLRADVERYVVDRFRRPDGRWRFSCHQDFLKIRRAGD